MASAAAPGLFFCFIAMVLLIFVCVSAPIWNAISFLNAGFGGESIHFGVFGYTGSTRQVGYTMPAELGAADVNTTGIRNGTRALILHPIAAALAGLSVIFGLCGMDGHRSGAIFLWMTALLAVIFTAIAWLVDMILFGIIRSRVREAGGSAEYANATWLTLGALAALLLGSCVGFFGMFGRYSTNYRNRNGKYVA